MSVTEVVMPSMGEGVHEATLVKWLKKAGDRVEADEPLLEVSTDKVDTEIPASSDGVLVEILVREGETVKVNQVLGTISDGSQVAASPKPESIANSPGISAATLMSEPIKKTVNTPPSIPKATVTPHPSSDQQVGVLQRTSPVVRKIAKEHGICLDQVKGSGSFGRVTKRDMESYLKDFTRSTTTAKPPGSEQRPKEPLANLGLDSLPSASKAIVAVGPAQGSSLDKLNTTWTDGREYLEGVAIERVEMSRMRKLIAEHMVASVRTSPHVTTVFEVDMFNVTKVRESCKNRFMEEEGFNLTYTHFIVHAAIQAIKLHPIVNTSLDGDEILFKQDINIGCAVAIEGGLIVPVLKKAGGLNLLGVSRGLNDLVVRAKSKRLKPDDVKGGTFSITNPGGYGSITSNPIINQPQVAILGIGAIVKRPVVIKDAIALRPMMMMSLTFDHRVIDGEGGALYLADLKKILESYDESPLG